MGRKHYFFKAKAVLQKGENVLGMAPVRGPMAFGKWTLPKGKF